jgi:2-methylisocitrate lyase-like PEP mutase family enzyme
MTRFAAQFRQLHAQPRGFVMPNVWDAGSAVVAASAGFQAIATTSAGVAFSLARADYLIPEGARPVTRQEMLDRAQEIAAAVDVPVNGDLEAGYGRSPEAVAETISGAIDAGLAGGNIEDQLSGEGLFDEELAVERIVAARETIDAKSSVFVLTARTDGQLLHACPLSESIRRANRFREAGADCLYVTHGADELEVIATLVKEIDGPVNVVMGLHGGTFTTKELLDLGVARISTGGSVARATLGFVQAAVAELRDRGTLGFLAGQVPHMAINSLFS